MQAQNYLRISSDFQSKTINRVTSGMRIVSSGDDAAGLAIANGYRSDEAVLTQGVRNANDGLSQLQIMDGGISNISQLLDRARTLATQSASGTFTGDRSVVNGEFQSVLSEIDRQAQSIGLDTGGLFAKSLSVFMGGGKTNNGVSAIQNGSVSVDLTTSTVDSRSLGLKGVQASGVAATDIGSGSASTSLSAILSNGTNSGSEKTSNYTTFYLKGPGFDSQGVAISVNTQNLGGTSDLVAAINAAISAAANGGTQQSTALKNAQITASVVTDSQGRQQLGFNSSVAGFQVAAGDRMANALMGNFAQNAVTTGTDAAATVDTSVNTTLSFKFDGSSTQINVTTIPSATTTSKGAVVAALNADTNFHAAATAYLDGNKVVVKSNTNSSSSAVTIVDTALSQSLGLSAGSNVTTSAAAATTGADLATRVQGAKAVALDQSSYIGTDTAATATITTATNDTVILTVGATGPTTLTMDQGVGLTKDEIAANLNTKIAGGALAAKVTASVVNNQIVFTAANVGDAITVGNGTADATLGLTTGGTASSNTFVNSDAITFRFQGAGMTSPVDIALNSITGGTTTLANALADLQSKVAGNSTLTKAGITLSTSATGNNLVFSSTSGQQFQVSVTGDSQNKFGMGSFLAGAAGVYDYTTITAANPYSTGAAGGTGTASVEFSLNGNAPPTTVSVSLNGSTTDATAGKATGTVAFVAGQVDLSANAAATGVVKLRIDGSTTVKTVTLGNAAATNMTAILATFNTQLGAAGVASLDSTGHLQITSNSKGAGSTVEVLSAALGSEAATLTNLGLTAGVQRGANASETNVIAQLNSAIAQNTTLNTAGLEAKDNAGSIQLVSTNNTNFRVDTYGTGYLGFGTRNAGSTFAGNQVSTAPAVSPMFDANGADMSAVLGFSDILYGGDKQTVSVTALDATGTKHSLGVILQNSGSSRNGRSIDEAISAINTALQQSNDSTLQQVVAVKEDNAGSQAIRFVSTLPSFQVSVGNTAGGTGITPPTGNISSATIVGAGANASILDQASAQNAVTALTNAVSALGKAQAVIGRGQNQFNYAINLAQSQLTNLTTAESRIRDADLAAEAANLTKAQILLQAGVAALAQANAAPQAVLSLLKG